MGKHKTNRLSNPLQIAIFIFDSKQSTQTSNSFPIGIYVNFQSETHKLYTDLAYFCSLSRCRSFYLLAMLSKEMVLFCKC